MVKALGLLLVVLLLLTASVAMAAPPREAAANTLAAAGKLFCHRTFRATSWLADASFTNSYYEADQDTNDQNLCGFESGNGNRVLYSTGAGTPQVGVGLNSVAVMQHTKVVPSGGDSYFLAVEALVGSQPYQQGSLTGRVGHRWYNFFSDGSCVASKYIQMGMYWSGPEFTASGLFKWQGAGESMPGFNTNQFIPNKWYRIEHYIDNYANPSSVTVFLKNITDDAAEVSVTVTTTCVSGGDFCMRSANPGPNNNQLQNFTQFIHMYRDNRNIAGTCVNKYSYLLVGKNLGASERIPVAVEVDGGAPPPTAFDVLATQGTYGLTGAVVNLTQLPGPTLIGFVHRAVLVTIILAALILWRKRHVDR